mmetsp:Transcript_6769/g.27622  ORF Transcript_6769/g.27622 Transcript_6769/m.27622 type:complete len:213 (+) Transcript_6769:2346-2984(+)
MTFRFLTLAAATHHHRRFGTTSRRTFSGRSVMSALGLGGSAPGLSRTSTALATIARSSALSIMAKPVPMQTLGPAPNGTYTPPGPMPLRAPFAMGASASPPPAATFSPAVPFSPAGPFSPDPAPRSTPVVASPFGTPPGSSQRSGRNSPGASQYLASLCSRYGAIRTVVPLGSAYLPPAMNTSWAQHLPTMYAGGCIRIVSSTTASAYFRRE